MTTSEILFSCDLSRATVFRQIRHGLVRKDFHEWVLDFTPFHKRKVRLIGFEIENATYKWDTPP